MRKEFSFLFQPFYPICELNDLALLIDVDIVSTKNDLSYHWIAIEVRAVSQLHCLTLMDFFCDITFIYLTKLPPLFLTLDILHPPFIELYCEHQS